jgi:hypothetical protein
MSSLTGMLNSPAFGSQMAQGANLTGGAGVPTGGVTWGNVLNAANQANNRNYMGAFQSLTPQQSASNMQGLQIPEEQKQKSPSDQALSMILSFFTGIPGV